MRHFPVFRLRVSTPRLELRLPSLDDLDDLADLAVEGIHDPESMPFLFPWTDAEPARRAWSAISFHFRTWASWTPQEWTCPFVVVCDGRIAGVQEVSATDFAVTREVSSGSWLGRRFHGRGIGTEMRTAVLHLAFDGLDALSATSGAFTDNHASLAVSRKLGYRDDGVDVRSRRGGRAETRRLRLSRDDWTTPPGFEVHGLEPCLPLFGAGPTE
ncbi:GNAT family protein [Planomonospora venezuelensis]|uniref:RimJ/RimL family protein N-acetyltransferase n=1 Tax=Planomonospora venezuelensis TaxID=1999 RepID=A0A841D1J1_PLAVE|nr:RimJ/RimL family protein N-acetyltransferase [Planomonospora venezuelensis]